MEEMTVSGLVSLFPETKSEILLFVDKMVDNALDGWVNPLQTEAQLACMEKVVKDIRANKDFKNAVLSEAEKYGQKTFEAYNSNVQIKETGVKYDYSLCGHSRLNELYEQIERLKEEIKGIEKYLQSVPDGTEYINPQTGEINKLSKPIKTSTTQVVITINK